VYVEKGKGALRHEGCCESEPEESEHRDEARDTRREAAAGSKQRGEERENGEDKTHQVEDPAEAPHVVVVFARGVFAVRTAFVRLFPATEIENQRTPQEHLEHQRCHQPMRIQMADPGPAFRSLGYRHRTRRSMSIVIPPVQTPQSKMCRLAETMSC